MDRRIRVGSVIAFLVAAAIGALALLSVRPDLFIEATKVTLRSPVAQILAMRGWIIAALAGAALFFVLMGAIRKHLVNRGRVALFLAFLLAVASIGHFGVMFSRGLFPSTALPHEDASITVLEYNTAGSEDALEDLAYIIEENNVDVATLPETPADTGRKLAELLKAGGREYHVFDNGRTEWESAYSSTVILLAADLGEYEHDSDFAATSNVNGVLVRPAHGDGPTFVAVHPIAPSQARLRTWRVDMLEAYSMCAEHENIIMGGDFNSTVDHEAALHLGTPCRDAGAEAGAGATGTWPSNLPGFFASPIDRVLTNSRYEGTAARIVETGTSDHKGIIVELTPRS